MNPEKIFFLDSEKNRLAGLFSAPSEDKKIPAIIFCHGFQSDKNNTTGLEVEKRLHRKNIATFRFDFFGHGDSEGDFADITVSRAVDSLIQAVSFLKDRGYTRLGLVGSSFGGLASLIAASGIESLLVLALKCPVSERLGELVAENYRRSIQEWKEQGFIEISDHQAKKRRLNYSFYIDANKHDSAQDYSGIKAPALIVHGDADDLVPVEQSIKTAEAIPNCRLEIIPGAGHSFKNGPHFEQMVELISGFILSQMHDIN